MYINLIENYIYLMHNNNPMSDLRIKSELQFSNRNFSVGLSLVEFIEDNVTIIYSPALDLSGYGNDHEEAKKSFEEALHEFIKYTHNKNTLDKVLVKLGWSIKGSKKKPKFNAPNDSDLVKSNSLYKEIVNHKNYSVSRKDVAFAL